MTEEENSAASPAAKEVEDLRWTDLEKHMEAAAADLERRMEDAVDAAEITKRGMEEAAEEAGFTAAAKVTAFLSLLVGLCTDRCAMF